MIVGKENEWLEFGLIKGVVFTEDLLSLQGVFQGHGINHDQERFEGVMRIHSPRVGFALVFDFTATGEDGNVFHAEHTLIARDLVGNLRMVSVSDNTAALLDYRLVDAHETSWLFQFGKLTDRETFRETRQIILHEDASLAYYFSWGMPGGDFAERSSVKLIRLDL